MSFLQNLFGSSIHFSVVQEKGAGPIAILAIPRDMVEQPSEKKRAEFKKAVSGVAMRCVKDQGLWKIRVRISGYNDDPRELFEIPEVCTWAKDTYKELPGLLFFLTKTDADLFTAWLCGPVSRKETETSEFQTRFVEMQGEWNLPANVAFFKLLEEAGASQELIKDFYSQKIQERWRGD